MEDKKVNSTEGDGDMLPEGGLWGVIVTYRRPEDLSRMITSLEEQTRRVDHLIVVDNASETAVREAAVSAGATYIDAGDNLGPAGGIALGLRHVLERADPADWVMLFDDDDPPRTDELVEQLWVFAHECVQTFPRTAGVGLAGARYLPTKGIVERVRDEELRGLISVDHIGGNQLPLYSVRAVQAVGVPDPGLFFGFEELEYGLRFRAAGYSLLVCGELWMVERGVRGRRDLGKQSLRTTRKTAGWRRYYTVRNTTLIAKRHGTPRAAITVAIVGGVKACLALASVGRPLNEVILPLRGAVDGWLERTGRTVNPGDAIKTT